MKIGNSVRIYKDSPEEGKNSVKGFLIYGEIGADLMKKGLEIKTKEFAFNFNEFLKGKELRYNLMNALELESSEGKYLFYDSSGGILRCWVSKFGGNAQIDPYNLERYKNNPRWNIPEKITSDNVDFFNQQKFLVSMLEKYISFLENYNF